MICVRDLLRASIIQEAMIYGSDEKPVYVRLQDGSLAQIDAIGETQLRTSAGAHDIVVLAVGAPGEEM
jgi:hypothetical protein